MDDEDEIIARGSVGHAFDVPFVLLLKNEIVILSLTLAGNIRKVSH